MLFFGGRSELASVFGYKIRDPNMVIGPYAYDFLGQNVSTIPAGLSGSGTSTTSSIVSGFHQIYIRYTLDVGNGKLGAFRP